MTQLLYHFSILAAFASLGISSENITASPEQARREAPEHTQEAFPWAETSFYTLCSHFRKGPDGKWMDFPEDERRICSIPVLAAPSRMYTGISDTSLVYAEPSFDSRPARLLNTPVPPYIFDLQKKSFSSFFSDEGVYYPFSRDDKIPAGIFSDCGVFFVCKYPFLSNPPCIQIQTAHDFHKVMLCSRETRNGRIAILYDSGQQGVPVSLGTVDAGTGKLTNIPVQLPDAMDVASSINWLDDHTVAIICATPRLWTAWCVVDLRNSILLGQNFGSKKKLPTTKYLIHHGELLCLRTDGKLERLYPPISRHKKMKFNPSSASRKESSGR
ncbi:hypothetical protein [Akkermansia sp.]|uniref:hypothetical protein n=1 Tax=Akkermansia sp. TaxID=1872421 RepID=UPI0025BEA8A3|nr:hypothetical protein [Akkermansia sp.]MCD8065423.1 hypothetical protein [Akkermansia sp.]